MNNDLNLVTNYIVGMEAGEVYESTISISGKYYNLIQIDMDAYKAEGIVKMKRGTSSIFGAIDEAHIGEDLVNMIENLLTKTIIFKHGVRNIKIFYKLQDALDEAEYIRMELEEKKTSDTPEMEDLVLTEEAKIGILECLDFVQNSKAYIEMGAKRPRGILLEGPPGTGKTSIATAIAKAGNANFIYASGSEFVEKYVGVGAKRVRELFEKARKEKSIIFIDEIDAVGSARTDGENKEDNKTLNQLLIEMDGFKKDDDILVIAATNRADLLDAALLRPGRFTRHYKIDLPTEEMRIELFKVYVNKVKHAEISDEDMAHFASLTDGFSGAEIANAINEAAIYAVRVKAEMVDVEHIIYTIDLEKNKKKNTNSKGKVNSNPIGFAL